MRKSSDEGKGGKIPLQGVFPSLPDVSFQSEFASISRQKIIILSWVIYFNKINLDQSIGNYII